ncbi:GlsB/YeaQ/YmgE family stress response membrane protein, partial [Synechococcus sp. BA-132 BA5]|uniref:GlsB/YeaQ/YmgE family stress response membrane protein n=1 Tax=Synechococcus sp. BA-132 BA5 TaxID=3110252 RepID=UPI003FCD0D28
QIGCSSGILERRGQRTGASPAHQKGACGAAPALLGQTTNGPWVIAGWLAGVLVKGGGFGLIGDLVVGIIGALIGGLLFSGLGGAVGGGVLGSIVVATLGAVILLVVLRVIRRA